MPETMKKTLFFPVLKALFLTLSLALPAFAQAKLYKLEISMSASDRETLKANEKTEVAAAKLRIFEFGKPIQEADISVASRGQTSVMKFQRKNLTIKSLKSTEGKATPLQVGTVKGRKLILSASPEDVLGTKNMVSYLAFQAARIQTITPDYAEVILNGKSQGLYMISLHPADYILKETKADIVVRRRYSDKVEVKEKRDEVSEAEAKQYLSALTSIHKSMTKLEGEALVEALSKNLNLGNYMRWLAVNYVLRNGDYLDEVFFIGYRKVDGSLYFDVTPWDLDDTFAEKMHLANIPFMKNQGKEGLSRSQLLYSYESALDRAIARDPVLLAKYHQVAEKVVDELLQSERFQKISEQVESKLLPYLNNEEILANGKLDAVKRAHNAVEVLEGLKMRQDLLNQRLVEMKREFEIIRSEKPGSRASPNLN